MAIDKRNLVKLDRDDLTQVAELAWRVIDDDEASPQLRRDAERIVDHCTRLLCFGPEWSAALVPVGFTWEGHYTELVEAFLIDIGERVCAERPAQVTMARQCAAAVDCQGYGTEYRLDLLSSLNEVIASLQQAKAELAEVES